jgi:hypothetical protein
VLKRKVIIVENSSQLEDKLEKILNEWKAASEDQGLWSSAKHLVKQIYIVGLHEDLSWEDDEGTRVYAFHFPFIYFFWSPSL